MNNQELQKLVEKISLESFGRAFTHQAIFNNRLKSTGGRYHLSDHHLDFNNKLFAEISFEEQVGIIKHELCHYHLHLTGGGYKHADQDFKRLLKQTGGSRYAPSRAVTPKKYRYQYECANCQLDFFRQRRIDTRRFVCAKCGGHLLPVVSQVS